jgi:hypothetical protein
MSDDDLADFFDEVDEVVEEAKKEVEGEGAAIAANSDAQETTNAQQPNDEDSEIDRPAKKARISSDEDARVDNPRGALIVSKKAATNTTTRTSSTISAPPIVHNQASSSTTGSVYQITVPEECLNPNPRLPPPPPPAPPAPPAMGNYQYYDNHNQGHAPNGQESSAKPSVRVAAGKKWTDSTLSEFPENDYRLFVGNLDKILTEAKLAEAFQSKFPSFAMCRIIYDKVSGESKGYGFVSLMDPKDCARAIREMDQSWLGSRPIKVKRSDWKERDLREIRKDKKKKRGSRGRRR